jgi:lysophospholipase L1-like esterase
VSRRWYQDGKTLGVLALASATAVFAGWVLIHDPGPVMASTSPQVNLTEPSGARLVVSLWIGDSYTNGTGSGGLPTVGEACLTAKALGWVCRLDAEGGTGFLADGRSNSERFGPLSQRFAATSAKYDPDVVVIDAGRNDYATPKELLQPAIRSYFQRVEEAWPDATVVVIAPYLMGDGDGSPHGVHWIGDYEKTLAKKHGWTFVDPVDAGWPATTRRLTVADGVHPNAEGHRYIAEHLAAALKDVKP